MCFVLFSNTGGRINGFDNKIQYIPETFNKQTNNYNRSSSLVKENTNKALKMLNDKLAHDN